jgi:hypothetical protein
VLSEPAHKAVHCLKEEFVKSVQDFYMKILMSADAAME